jgi:hypothetical protein
VRGHHPHVPFPMKPTPHFGGSATQACGDAEEWAESQTVVATRHGKPAICRRRRDQPCAVVGVASVPPDFPHPLWPQYIDAVIYWLKRKYGECLKSVIEHTDESQRHLHFWVVPRLGAQFSSIHQGVQAREKLPKTASQDRRKAAFGEAMRQYQDEFFAVVSKRFGLLRTSVRGQRFTRAGFKLWKACRDSAAKLNQKLEAEAAVRAISDARDRARYASRIRANQDLLERQAAARAEALQSAIKAESGRLRTLPNEVAVGGETTASNEQSLTMMPKPACECPVSGADSRASTPYEVMRRPSRPRPM